MPQRRRRGGRAQCPPLRDAEEALYGVRTLSEDLKELYERLKAARCEVYDLAESVRDKREEFDFSPGELDQVEARRTSCTG